MNSFFKLLLKLDNYISGNWWKVASYYDTGIYKFGVYKKSKSVLIKNHSRNGYPYYSSQEAQIECDRLNNGGAIEYN